MGKKGKGKKNLAQEPSQQQQQQQQERGPPVAQQQQQRPPTPQQQQQRQPTPQQQQQGQHGTSQQRGPMPQQQQQGQPTPQQQQQGQRGSWQQRGPVPQQQQQGQPTSQQQQQGPPVAWQQGGPVPQQQQQGPPTRQQQQQGPRGAWQQRGPVPQQQQQGQPTPQQQQQGLPTPQQQQQGQPTPQQQQQGQRGSWQQRGPVPQQQQQGQPTPQQQQQGQRGSWQQRGPVPQQQQQGQPTPQQQQQGPPTPQQQQQGPPVAWQQGGSVPQQQQQGQPTRQQQQQGPRGAWQQRGPVPQQQQQGQPTPQQQQQGLPTPQQQQQGQPTPQQQQQGQRGSWQQRGPVPQQQQQGQPTPQQQQQGLPTPQQQQQGLPTPQQQQQGPPVAWQQGGSVPQQQQQGQPTPQQQQQGPRGASQQRGPVPQQQQQGPSARLEPSAEQLVSQHGQLATYFGDNKKLNASMVEKYLKQIPVRKNLNGGTAGRRITVETNMLTINLDKFQTDVTHYDVVIEPDKPKFLLRPAFEAYRQMCFPQRYPAFDGKKNAYSAKDLPFGDTSPQEEVKVFDVERQQHRTFKVYMRKVNRLDLTWLKKVACGFTDLVHEQSSFQVLDIILRHGAASICVNVGRSLFSPPEGTVVSLSNGLDLWVGIFQSAIIGWKPFLNVDVAHKGFPSPQSIIDLMKDLCKHPRDLHPLENIRPQDVAANSEKITKFLKGLKVQYEIPGQPNSKRTYRVNELVASARKNTFALENGQKCTVEQYFAQQKNYTLRYPELPCLWVGSRNNQRKIHLPAELCTIVAGQVTQKKMDDVQTSKMIKYAATDTATRKEKIKNGFSKMRINDQPTLLKEFKLSVNHDFEKVPARVLEPPKLKYDRTQPVSVMKGVWRADRFLNPSSLADDEWTILNLDKYTSERALHDGLHYQLQQGGKAINMSIGRAKTPFTCLQVPAELRKLGSYFNEKKNQKVRLVVVIIPSLDGAYSSVKQYSELKTPGGMVTQVLKAQTLRKLNPATITNILLKINSKLNGVNHKLLQNPPCLQKPCMLVGADVTHPAPDAIETPSIAAVTASYSPSAFQYHIEIRLQPPREEMIRDLEEIMVKQLTFFYNATSHKPQQIIFYRDGVSEGQLPQVLHYEMSAIKRAIAKMGSGESIIPITFLVVQKRHHTRFFPTDKRNSDDRNMNVQAGTIVDTNITHPTHIDFYLVSHASIQGTARPTKYRCIANEIGMTEDEIEQLTYYLCHLFSRCTRSVSYPAPTYYAHLAAFRARALIQGVKLDIDNLHIEQRSKMTLQMQNSPMFFV